MSLPSQHAITWGSQHSLLLISLQPPVPLPKCFPPSSCLTWEGPTQHPWLETGTCPAILYRGMQTAAGCLHGSRQSLWRTQQSSFEQLCTSDVLLFRQIVTGSAKGTFLMQTSVRFPDAHIHGACQWITWQKFFSPQKVTYSPQIS